MEGAALSTHYSVQASPTDASKAFVEPKGEVQQGAKRVRRPRVRCIPNDPDAIMSRFR